ncbi:baeRF12 domain-containing protein [Marimonas arenosa]|uniref:Host attachment family protein n=1 Tax=Marimonas arenosa TaxID=1795305 RepID=A0AAE4B637_9RHOB|nr:host attachment protein [Marimonas arenosa]MDQ2091985.1 host attachment family protein [Marimonas arenosa]
MKPKKTLILLASEDRMRLCENTGVGKGVREFAAKSVEDYDDIAAGYADMPGRGQAAPGVAGHKFERPTSERDQARGDFATHVIAETAQAFSAGGYDRLVMAAAPKMLGELRQSLPKGLKTALLEDLAKDLTNTPEADLAGHFADVLAV